LIFLAKVLWIFWQLNKAQITKIGIKEQQNPERIKELANIPVKYLKMPGVADNEWQTVYLQVKVRKGAVCTFAYSLDGKKYTTVGESFTARQGKWIGAKVGLFCVTPNEGNRGWADVDWFRMNK
jgi:hypothetical protein